MQRKDTQLYCLSHSLVIDIVTLLVGIFFSQLKCTGLGHLIVTCVCAHVCMHTHMCMPLRAPICWLVALMVIYNLASMGKMHSAFQTTALQMHFWNTVCL